MCPLLFDGQYADGESGWAYNRFRYYSPDLGVYGAQDPLGLSPNLGWAQGYVAHPGCMVDVLGLMAHKRNVSALDAGYLRGGPHVRLETIGPDGLGVQRHHIISQDALRANGLNPDYAPSIQMTPSLHSNTLSHGSRGLAASEYRAYEARMIAGSSGNMGPDLDGMDKLAIDELARIEQLPGHSGTDGPMEALNSYRKWKDTDFGPLP